MIGVTSIVLSLFGYLCRGTEGNILSVGGAFVAAVIFTGVNNAATVQPVVATERTVFYRERAAGMYSAGPYAIAQVLNIY